MLARNSSVIQFGLTGLTGSASAAGSAVSVLAARASSKALSFPAVGGSGWRIDPVRVDQVVLGKALGEFAGLGVPHPHPVAGAEPVRRGPYHRRLNLARAFVAVQPQARGEERARQPVRRPGPRRNVAAA